MRERNETQNEKIGLATGKEGRKSKHVFKNFRVRLDRLKL